ncbi:protein lplB [Spirochaetia bacterium]|nr:protein lplB [Spirochaetia bacterium]
MRNKQNERLYRLMTLPGLIFLVLFSYIPMFGIVIAFQRFVPALGIFRSPFFGLGNFEYMFDLPEVGQVFFNTVFIALCKIVAGQIVPIIFALLLNEVTTIWFKKTVQTIVYLPHFLSWVILGTIFKQMLGFTGIVNSVITGLGGEVIQFLGDGSWFRFIIIITDVWKGFGFGTIVYLAAILAINPSLYEAATIDGANRFQRILHITIPCMAPTIVLMATLSLGGVLNAGFDQIFNMYNPLVYQAADILDTYVYRIGLINMQYGLSTAVGLLKSVISSILIVVSYTLAYKFAGYRIF